MTILMNMQTSVQNQIYFGFVRPLLGESSPNSRQAVRRVERGESSLKKLAEREE